MRLCASPVAALCLPACFASGAAKCGTALCLPACSASGAAKRGAALTTRALWSHGRSAIVCPCVGGCPQPRGGSLHPLRPCGPAKRSQPQSDLGGGMQYSDTYLLGVQVPCLAKGGSHALRNRAARSAKIPPAWIHGCGRQWCQASCPLRCGRYWHMYLPVSDEVPPLLHHQPHSGCCCRTAEEFWLGTMR